MALDTSSGTTPGAWPSFSDGSNDDATADRRRRRWPALVTGFALALAGCVSGTEVTLEGETQTEGIVSVAGMAMTIPEPVTTTTAAPTTTTTVATTTTIATTTTTEPPPPSDSLVLTEIARLTGELSSKSVVSSGAGLFFAQNMMYQHTITVFDENEQLVATIPDSIDLSAFGVDVEPGDYRGAPVEAAFTSDGRYGFVSNYRMYGPGFFSTASDGCNKGAGQNSYVYRIDTERLAEPLGEDETPIDAVYEVGSVPKYLDVTPDDRLLLVTNWCTFDLSVIDLETGATLTSIELGRHPRGIAISSDSTTAYVTIMGGSDIAVIDLDTFDVSWLENVGPSPRHVVLSPDDATLYATLNGAGTVVKIDVATGDVIDSVRTGQAPRSMDISTDGRSLYVVNYESDTMSKVATESFDVVQEVRTAHHPIGITYDQATDEVWVSAYSGVIHVFAQVEPEADTAD